MTLKKDFTEDLKKDSKGDACCPFQKNHSETDYFPTSPSHRLEDDKVEDDKVNDDNAKGSYVVSCGMNALKTLLSSWPMNFSATVECLTNLSGKIILSGMGKSGWVAKKMASTLSSCGIPAFFLHPAEAAHGDLGALSKDDALILISYSGTTEELYVMERHGRHLGIPTILITSQGPETLLKKLATLCLEIPSVEEACPLKMAPTTSTLTLLALGDALSLCLMQQRSFTKEDYHRLHPAGFLGHSMLSLKDIMHTQKAMPLVHATALMQEAILEMTHKRFGSVGVIDDHGCLVGIISDGDLRRHLSAQLLSESVTSIMTSKPKVLPPQAFVHEALALMQEKSITVLFVVEGECPVGIVHLNQCIGKH